MDALFYDFINQFGYFAVGALIFIENVFPPIPSEVILPLSGFFTTTTDMVLPLVIASATAGSVLGAYILYGIGYVLSRERLMRFFETRPMRLLGFKGTDIASACLASRAPTSQAPSTGLTARVRRPCSSAAASPSCAASSPFPLVPPV